ncbi:alginate export family protein [Calditrichota bacterium]
MKVYGKTFSMILATLIISSLCLAPLAFAGESSGKIFADTRYRTSFDGRDFNGDTGMDNTQWLRTRIGMKFQQDDVKAFLQFQYPLTFANAAPPASGNVGGGVHQLYIKYNGFYLDDLAVKAGRFEMNYGDERLIGSVGWSNVGRTFDGLKFHYDNEMLWADYFLTTLTENSVGSPNTNAKDDLFHGVWAELKGLKLNLFYLMQRNTTQIAGGSNWHTGLSRSTLGLHYMNQYGSGLGTLLDFAMQMGTATTFGAPNVETDLSAMLVVAAVWYKFEDMAMSPTIGAGIDMASGDDPTTPENEAFSNLYYTGHKWRGAMDYFINDNPIGGGTNPGLTDIMVKAYVSPWETGKVGLGFHMFSTGEDFASNAPGGGTATALGNEIDLFYMNDYSETLTGEAGVSMFMPSEDWQGASPDNSMWIYIQLSSKFDAFAWGE